MYILLTLEADAAILFTTFREVLVRLDGTLVSSQCNDLTQRATGCTGVGNRVYNQVVVGEDLRHELRVNLL